jgi:PAS domain S-box-containing protein
MDASLAAMGIGPLARLRAAVWTQIDPQVLLLAVRDSSHRIVDFECADANQAAAEFLGQPVDVVVGGRMLELDPDQEVTGLFATYTGAVESGDDLILDDYAFPRPSAPGAFRHFDIRARKVGDALSISWRDVTDRWERSPRPAAAAESGADVVVFSRDGVLEWVSPSITELFGWTPEECVGRPGEFLVHPDDLDHMLRSRATLYGGGSTRYRLRHVRKDGGIVWCEARGRSVMDDDGEVRGACIAIRDISGQIGLEPALESAEERYRLMAEHASDVGYITDPDGNFAWITPSVESVLGWTSAELIGAPVDFVVATEDLPDRGDGWGAVLGEDGSHEPIEIRFRTKQGPLVWMSLRADPVRDDDGTVTAAVCSLRLCQSEVVERWAASTLSAGNALLAEATDEEELLSEMCETAVRNGGYRFAWYGRKVDAPGCPVEPVASSKWDGDYLEGPTVTWDDGPFGRGPTGRALRSEQTVIEPDLVSDPGFAPWGDRALARGFRSTVSLPVRVNGIVDGTFNVYAAELDAFGSRVVDLLEDLARSLGFGIERLRDRRDLEVAFANSIDLVASVVESRDAYTAGHQSRVAELSAAIGRELGLDERRVEGLTYAATIHDVGKVGVSIDLLSRPGTLSPEEMALIRRHSRIGWEITSRFEWPWPVAEIVYQHHERMDGSGYPLGLRGDEILLESRIVAVADVFEAVSSRRPYREALGEDTARAIVAAGSGTLFDALVVGAFLRVLDGGFAYRGSSRTE